MGSGVNPDQYDNLSTTNVGDVGYGQPDAVADLTEEPSTESGGSWSNGFATLDATGNVPVSQLGNAPGGSSPGAFPQILLIAQLAGPLGSYGIYKANTYLTWATTAEGAFDTSIITAPDLIAPSSQVINITAIEAEISGVDTTGGVLLMSAQLRVSNLLGTEMITVAATQGIGQIGPDQSAGIDFTGATPSTNVGTDLAWDPTTESGGVNSTAGGIFVAQLELTLGWDD